MNRTIINVGIAGVALLVFLFLCTHICYSEELISVIDGDTIVVMSNNKEEHIRLYGIDAPELRQAYGQQAKRHLENIISKEVRVQKVEKGFYGRTIALVYPKDSDTSYNEMMVVAGYAWIYEFFCSMDICSDWKILATKAMNTNTGLWNMAHGGMAEPPWLWRKAHKRKKQLPAQAKTYQR